MHRIIRMGKSYITGKPIEIHLSRQGNVANLRLYSDHGATFVPEVTREQLQDLRHIIDEAISAIALDEKNSTEV